MTESEVSPVRYCVSHFIDVRDASCLCRVTTVMSWRIAAFYARIVAYSGDYGNERFVAVAVLLRRPDAADLRVVDVHDPGH